MPITTKCLHCGKEFLTYPSTLAQGRGRHCSRKCSSAAMWAARVRPAPKYRTLRLPDHPLATKGGLVQEHRVVLYDKIGPGPHQCHWCGDQVKWTPGAGHNGPQALHVDHLDTNGLNNAAENLVPSCKRCNWGRSRRIRDDEVFTFEKGRKRRAIVRHCLICGTQFVRRPDPRPNHGLYCSQSCARKGRRSA